MSEARRSVRVLRGGEGSELGEGAGDREAVAEGLWYFGVWFESAGVTAIDFRAKVVGVRSSA